MGARCCAAPKLARVVWLGLDDAGTSSLLCRLLWNFVPEPLPPTGAVPVTATAAFGGGQLPKDACNLEPFDFRGRWYLCWDVGGRAHLRGLWRVHLRSPAPHALVWVVDGSRDELMRMDESKRALRDVLATPTGAAAPLLVLVNKDDEGDFADAELWRARLGLEDREAACHIANVSSRGGRTRRAKLLAAFEWLHGRLKDADLPTVGGREKSLILRRHSQAPR